MTEVTRSDREREAWRRVGIGGAIATGAGYAGQRAAKDLILNPPAKTALAPHFWRLAAAGKPAAMSANILARGAQLSGVGLATTGAVNLERGRRGRMKTQDPVTTVDALKDAATSAIPARSSGDDSDESKRARSIKGVALTGSSLGALTGAQALAQKLPARYRVAGRAAAGTGAALGTAALLHRPVDRLVRETTKGKARLDDKGEVVVKRRITDEERLERLKLIGEKNLQTGLSLTGGAVGLTGLGMLATPKAAARVAQHQVKAGKLPSQRLIGIARRKYPYAAVTTAGAGIGGLSSLNYTRVSRGETRRERRELDASKPVVKRLGDSRSLKDDATALGAGVGAGLLASPARQPKARGARRDELNRMWREAAEGGAKPGAEWSTSLSPSRFARVAEQRGDRLLNTAETYNRAAKWAEGDTKAAPGNYRATLGRDPKTGTVWLRQQDGRHSGEVHSLFGRDVPANVHVVEGPAPAEKSGLKALSRATRSWSQRRHLQRNLDLPPETVARRGRRTLAEVRSLNSKLNQRFAHGVDAADERIVKPFKGVSSPNARRAAITAGAGAAALAGNKMLANVKDRNIANETRTALLSRADRVQSGVSTAFGKAAERDRRKEQAAAITAGAAGGATAGVLSMPMRDKVNRAGRRIAAMPEYRDLPEGTHNIDMPTAHTKQLAAPGVRPHNLEYTTRMGSDIARGKWKPGPNIVSVYDDTARFQGGQHRGVARSYAQQKTQPTELRRVKGFYGGVEPGHKALRTKVKRAVFPAWFEANNPGSKKKLHQLSDKIDPKKLERAEAGSTSAPAKMAPGWTRAQLTAHHRLQGKIMTGATLGGAALGAAADKTFRNKVEVGKALWGMARPAGTLRTKTMRRGFVRRAASGKMSYTRGSIG